MSLWDKWEKEKLEQMGVKVERKSDVVIRDTRLKTNIRKQVGIVVLSLAVCFVVVYCAWILNNRYSGHWSDLYIVRVISERTGMRIAERDNQ